MDSIPCLVIGAGVSGLAFANAVGPDRCRILEADSEIGGYCKTVLRDGFVWDYSGHFFHFRDPAIERWLVERMPEGEVRTIAKSSAIRYGDRFIDFPFQKNIHQLPHEEFLDCLYDLYFREEAYPSTSPPSNFGELLYQRFGRSIADKFLIPYNEKLYACSLSSLDPDAMGRFFPWAKTEEIVRNFRRPDNSSYNASFTYPRGGAVQYVRALARDIPVERIHAEEPLVSVDLERRVARTPRREVRFDNLVSSIPFPRLIELCGLAAPEGLLSWNQVLVFNLGFDRKGWAGLHWVYFPERVYPFYRIGFYDNIFGSERMSLYVELGFPAGAAIDVNAERERVLAGLKRAGAIDDHRLVAHHHVVMDPAYVHITNAGSRYVAETRERLARHGVHSIGRYGSWTYCSIEDNIVEARTLAARLSSS